MFILSSDNQLEVFKVNVSKPESILKKLVRAEKKKKALKRTHKEFAGAADQDAPTERHVDKAAL